MKKLYYLLLTWMLRKQEEFYNKKRLEGNLVFKDSTTITSMNGACSLKFSVKTEEKKQKVDSVVKDIVKKNIKTPEKLLELVESKGTKVYRSPLADKILNVIGESEGFITPLKGWKALYLNFWIGVLIEKKFMFSFKTKELFLLRNLPVNIYIMSHQFHKWYGYMMKLPGYDVDTQEKFKKIFRTLNNNEIKTLSLKEVVSIKEALARDKESVDLVLGISKEYEGARKAMNKIKNQNGASI